MKLNPLSPSSFWQCLIVGFLTIFAPSACLSNPEQISAAAVEVREVAKALEVESAIAASNGDAELAAELLKFKGYADTSAEILTALSKGEGDASGVAAVLEELRPIVARILVMNEGNPEKQAEIRRKSFLIGFFLRRIAREHGVEVPAETTVI